VEENNVLISSSCGISLGNHSINATGGETSFRRLQTGSGTGPGSSPGQAFHDRHHQDQDEGAGILFVERING
jgi:hypothetical protein